MRLLHVYSPSAAYRDRQRDTWTALNALEPALGARGWEIVHAPLDGDHGYDDALLEAWRAPGDLVLLEHDMVPTLDMLVGMETCEHPLCAQKYRLHFAAHTHDALRWLAERRKEMDPASLALIAHIPLDGLLQKADERERDTRNGCWEPYCHRSYLGHGQETRWGADGDDFADLVGFGLTCIRESWRRAHAPAWEPGRWGDLDGRFCQYVITQGGPRWHMHGPECPHRHPCAEAGWAGQPAGFGALAQGERQERLRVLAQAAKPEQVPWEIAQAMDRAGKPATVLEIGVDRGGTLARWASVATSDAVLVGVDREPPRHVPHLATQRVHLIRGDSHDPSTEAAVRSALSGRSVDLLFIDGDHSAGGVRDDLERYAPLVRPGGSVMLHDILPHPPSLQCHVDEVWRTVRDRPGAEEIVWDRRQGWGGIGVLAAACAIQEGTTDGQHIHD